MSEVDAVLDEIEEKLDSAEEGAPVETEEGEEKTKGYMSYDDWIAAGRDPKKFRGEEAFEEYGRVRDELKEYKDMLASQKTQLDMVLDNMTEWKLTQVEHLKQAQEQKLEAALQALNKAKEDEDMEAALQAQQAVNDLKTNAPTQPETSKELNPAIKQFISKHPILDKSSAQYDQDFYDDMTLFQGTILDKMTGGDPNRIQSMTEKQIERSMSLAYKEAKNMHSEKFQSHRNTRQSTPSTTPKREAPPVNKLEAMKGFGVNKMNRKDINPLKDIYELIKGKDQKEAEKFLEKLGGTE